MDQITESDILAGHKTIPITLRSGAPLPITVRALHWRKITEISSEPDLAKRNIATIEAAVSKDQLPLLDDATPAAIGDILVTIAILTNGIPSKKNPESAPPPNPASSIPPGRITSMPNPSSSNADIPNDFYVRGRQLNSASPSSEAPNAKPDTTSSPSPSLAPPNPT